MRDANGSSIRTRYTHWVGRQARQKVQVHVPCCGSRRQVPVDNGCKGRMGRDPRVRVTRPRQVPFRSLAPPSASYFLQADSGRVGKCSRQWIFRQSGRWQVEKAGSRHGPMLLLTCSSYAPSRTTARAAGGWRLETAVRQVRQARVK